MILLIIIHFSFWEIEIYDSDRWGWWHDRGGITALIESIKMTRIPMKLKFGGWIVKLLLSNKNQHYYFSIELNKFLG